MGLFHEFRDKRRISDRLVGFIMNHGILILVSVLKMILNFVIVQLKKMYFFFQQNNKRISKFLRRSRNRLGLSFHMRIK